MLTEERRLQIEKLVTEQGSISVFELASKLDVSESTIRRDITALDKIGRLHKVYGGAVALSIEEKPLLNEKGSKSAVQYGEINELAKFVVSLIKPNDCVFLDAGAVIECMVQYIKISSGNQSTKKKQATYVTNSIRLVQLLADRGIKAILVGGELGSDGDTLVGADAVLHLQKYNFTKAFLSADGIDEKLGATTSDVKAALIKRVVIEKTQPGQSYVIATGDVLGKAGAVTFSDYESVNIIKENN